MQKKQDFDATKFERINHLIKDFLKFNTYNSTLECLDAEEKTKLITVSKFHLYKITTDEITRSN